MVLSPDRTTSLNGFFRWYFAGDNRDLDPGIADTQGLTEERRTPGGINQADRGDGDRTEKLRSRRNLGRYSPRQRRPRGTRTSRLAPRVPCSSASRPGLTVPCVADSGGAKVDSIELVAEIVEHVELPDPTRGLFGQDVKMISGWPSAFRSTRLDKHRIGPFLPARLWVGGAGQPASPTANGLSVSARRGPISVMSLSSLR
jgi:hypothetical protein